MTHALPFRSSRRAMTAIAFVLVAAAITVGCGDSGATKKAPAKSAATKGAQPNKSTAARHGVEETYNALEDCVAITPDGSYTGCDKDADVVNKLAKNDVTLTEFTPKGYVVTGTSSDGATFSIRRGLGVFEHTCAPVHAPGCKDGLW